MTKKKAEQIVATIDPKLVTTMQSAFRRTWQECGGDWLQLMDGQDCRGYHVQECVADADRYADYTGDRGKKDQQTIDGWRALSRDQQDAILEITFPSKSLYS